MFVDIPVRNISLAWTIPPPIAVVLFSEFAQTSDETLVHSLDGANKPLALQVSEVPRGTSAQVQSSLSPYVYMGCVVNTIGSATS
ncbi:MAG: hypothetical protein EOO61_16600 [Hymenobacter sp.]|nr:MAG: hypothetical protein EOO61_16600 [Hymenobacter sp.]